MEPISLTASAIATLLLTKAVEKTGEELGEKALNQVGRLKQLLQRKSPDTATAISTVTQQPELAKVNPNDYGTQVLAQRLQSIANADPEIAEAVRSVADSVYAQPQSMQNLTNIANQIGVVAPGSVFTGDFKF